MLARLGQGAVLTELRVVWGLPVCSKSMAGGW